MYWQQEHLRHWSFVRPGRRGGGEGWWERVLEAVHLARPCMETPRQHTFTAAIKCVLRWCSAPRNVRTPTVCFFFLHPLRSRKENRKIMKQYVRNLNQYSVTQIFWRIPFTSLIFHVFPSPFPPSLFLENLFTHLNSTFNP